MEMLDAVEAAVAALRSRRKAAPPARASAGTASALRAALNAAGVSPVEFACAACVPQTDVEAWIAGRLPVPDWVHAAARLVALLTPSARRKLLQVQPGASPRRANSHPFSRIEEL